ncbi:MAG: hypothetical protein HXS46_02850 [Theionarchaea archaeon]|nr:MAG: hypothetical protein AYK18_04615 [Theionarchaea archaeon DG-70]MBU7009603.1 hypothetical protein [Theionarchaea archaeon]
MEYSTIGFDVRGLFQEDLLSDEEILWAGQPDPKRLFTGADIFLIPFSILWGGFTLFFFVLTWDTGIFSLFGLAFALAGLYFIFGRFFYKILKKKNTYYAVTNRRVLVLNTLLTRSLRAAFIDTIPTIHKSVRFGKGTITFGNRNVWASWYENTGMDFFAWGHGQDVPTFYDIKDAEKVYRLVNELRQKKEPEPF